jgi:hypothetical protein
VPDRNETRLETLAEASDQFHWGTDPDAMEAAAGALDRLRLNPVLSEALAAKTARLRTVARLLSDGLAAVAPSCLTSFAVAPPKG